MSVDIDQQAIDRIGKKLRSAATDMLKQREVSRVEQMALQTILMRTRRGEFLPGSKTPPEYSKSHARRRRKLGLQTDHVDLFMGENNMLEGLKSDSSVDQGDVSIEIGYIEGKTEARALQIATYLQVEGAGTNHVKYRHVGLTDNESNKIITYLKQRLTENLTGGFQ